MLALIHATPVELVEMVLFLLIGPFVGAAVVRLMKKRNRGNREH